CIFGQETIAWMDAVGAGFLGRSQDRGMIEIRLRRLRRADFNGFIGKPHGKRVLVSLAVDLNGRKTQLACGTNDTHSDLATVGYEKLTDGHEKKIGRTQTSISAMG